MRTSPVFVAVAVLLVAAGFAQATTELLVDRGLPTYGVDASSWAARTNIASGNYDFKDPMYAANGWTPTVTGDDFTLPSTADAYHVTNVRLWLYFGSTPFSDMFNSVGLMLGEHGSALSLVNTAPTLTQVQYPNGQAPNVYLWQLDYAVDFVGAAGAKYDYAILPDSKPGANTGNGESYYIAFMEMVRESAQTGFNAGGDGLVSEWYLNGTYASSWGTGGWGIGWDADYDVQVMGQPVPEPITMSLVGMGIVGLGGYLRRRMAK